MKAGIQEFVICPGGRNVSLISVLEQAEDVQLWTHYDERVAGFFALGRSMGSGLPVAVVTTSGTAVSEVHSAVIEARYQARPLVVISADRPAAFRGSGAPQVIDQVGIFGDNVERCIDVQAVDDANRCLDGWSGRAPLHINVCFDEKEERSLARLKGVETFSPVKEKFAVGDLLNFIRDAWNGLVVFVGGLEPEDRAEVYYFLKDLKVPVIADATSGLREALAKDRLLVAQPDTFFKRNMIGRAVRVGDVPVGRAWRDLENSSMVEVFSVSRAPFTGLARDSRIITGDLTRVLKGMGEIPEVGDVADALVGNGRVWAAIDELLESYPESEPSLVRMTSLYATTCSSLYLGNSMPIREWNEFAQRDVPLEFVRANRGANGIDGQLSTWIGNTIGMDDAWGVFGDLTAMYDMSALSLLEQCGGKRRVLVVINNSGGKIFERLPAVKELSESQREMIVNAQPMDFAKWAEMWGMSYQKIALADDFDIEAPDEGIVVEVVPHDIQTNAFWEKFARLCD